MKHAQDHPYPVPQRLSQDQSWDLVVIGGGLAGLSLVSWLEQRARVQRLPLPRVCLLEPRTEYDNDRTWCFWDSDAHPFDHLISHRWSNWQVSQRDRQVVQQGGAYRYAMLPAAPVYRQALATVQQNPNFTLCTNTRADQVVASSEGVLVTAGERQWTAKAVVDTRPPARGDLKQEHGLWQLFTGVEIECPNHNVELNRVRLMDFQPGADAVRFLYVLPLDQDRLLVEWTEFQPKHHAPQFDTELEAWLQNNLNGPYTIVRRESGALPMMEVASRLAPGRVVNAGVRGGWMRPATGYHFVACQRGARDLADQILAAHQADHWVLQSPVVHRAALRWMDRVFLRAIRQHPQQAPDWFMALFEGTSPAQMSRFMNDQPRLLDMVAVIRALPVRPFLRAALS